MMYKDAYNLLLLNTVFIFIITQVLQCVWYGVVLISKIPPPPPESYPAAYIQFLSNYPYYKYVVNSLFELNNRKLKFPQTYFNNSKINTKQFTLRQLYWFIV